MLGRDVLPHVDIIPLSAHSPHFDRARRDDLMRRRDELRYGEGYFNDPAITYFERRPMCDVGDICAYCEYAFYKALWPPDDDPWTGDSNLGWVDCMIATTTCRFCNFLTRLFFDNAPDFPKDQVVCETNGRRFDLRLRRVRSAEVTPTRSRKDQWNGGFSVSVNEISAPDVKKNSLYHYGRDTLFFSLDVDSRDEFIALLGAQSEEAAVLNLSRPIGEGWNSALFSSALCACKTHHGVGCEAAFSGFGRGSHISQVPAELGEKLRVVDVIDMCVTTLPNDMPYVALSYCWSQRRYSVLKLANYDEMSKLGGLTALSLPPVIKDAIAATRAIDERYIWIDSLCIIQDDHRNKAAELSRMDDIYRAASLTIIAASTPFYGTDLGLPGIQAVAARRNAATVELRGLKFRQCSYPLRHTLIDTKWHSRAWTFQEYLLSKRYLVFMPEQVYFVCQRASFAEDHIDHVCVRQREVNEQSLIPCCKLTFFDNESILKESHRPQHLVESYEELVAYYTMREMSFETDAINAVRGLLRLPQREHGIKFLCGLPVPHLIGYFLTWVPRGSCMERRPLLQHGSRFPSWSWAAWQGEVSYAPSSTPGPSYQPAADRFDHNGVHVDLESEITQWRVVLRPGAEVIDASIPVHGLEVLSEDFAGIDHCFLEFEAEVATFSIIADQYGSPNFFRHGEAEHSRCRQIIANGVWVGSVLIHDAHRPHLLQLNALGSQEQTFLSLSRAKARWQMWLPIDETNPSDERFFTLDDGSQIIHQPFDASVLDVHASVVNVLLVHTSETGVTYRVGVGQIHADAWDAASPERKQIVLG
jgi:hypothetical protein